MIDKRKKRYKTFIKKIDDIFDAFDDKNIIARRNWTCCNTCGCAEIGTEVNDIEEEDPNKRYIGYIFYHDQEAERIEEHLDQDDIVIMLNWGYCHEEDEVNDDNGIKLARTIEKIVVDNGHMLEYTDFSQKLALHIHI